MQPTLSNTVYRPDIDGMRALAVVLVMLYHADVQGFHGGYIGVDVFFVISGFLITRLLIDELRGGRFSMMHFYERRARRILPALFVMILLIIPPSVWFMVPFQVEDFGQSIVAVTVFASNFLFWRESGYFEAEADQKPLLHTWSLANEEQFYIIFPVILIILWRLSRGGIRPILASFLLVGLGSLIFAQYASSTYPLANFYLLPGRVWELLAGSICAVLIDRGKYVAFPGATGLGVLMITFSAFFFTAETPFPSLYTLIPVLGTMLVILNAMRGEIAVKLLSSGPMRGIGLISYSAYLWHMPLLAFLSIRFFGDTPLWMRVAAVAIALPIAYLSWLLVEKPCRDRERVSIVKLAVLGMIVVTPALAFGIGAHIHSGYRDIYLARLSPEAARFALDRDAEVEARRPVLEQAIAGADISFDINGSRRVLILGDSVSVDLFVALQRQTGMAAQFRRQRLDDTCFPTFLDGIGSERCLEEVADLRASGLIEQADEIVLAANWDAQTWPYGMSFAEQFASPERLVSIQGLAVFTDLASISFRLGEVEDRIPSFLYQNLRSRFITVNDNLEAALSGKEHARYLDKLELLCNRAAQSCDMLAPSGRPMIYDSAHFTLEAIDVFGDRIRESGWFE